jgi:hypothetical protein
VVVVDQADQVAEGLHRGGIVERELVTALEDATGRTDVVQVDPLGVVGRVVSPLADPPRVETRCARGVSVGVERQPGQQGA